MQPLFLKKNTRTHDQSFYVKEAIVPHMYSLWHYHQEIEINLVMKGTGTRFVGDHMENFSDQDLVMVGSNLPHVWKNDPGYFENNSSLYAHVINLQFQEDFAGKELMALPEFKYISNLVKKSNLGIRFYGQTYDEVAARMQRMVHLTGFDRLSELLNVLHILATSEEYYCLSKDGFMKRNNPFQVDKINRVYDFTLNNFTQPITIDDVAAIANMNPSAFCRFFKQVMHKTFVHFLMELRIGYACKLLINNDDTVARICYASGFQNLSNFNRQFREMTGKSPMQYRKEFSIRIE